MSFNPTSVSLLSSTAGIDATIIGVTDLFTVPIGQKAIVIGCAIYASAATSVTTVPTISIGGNGAQDDIFATVAITGITDTSKAFFIPIIGTVVMYSNGGVISFGIDNAAVATSLILKVDLLGYLTT